MAKRKYPSELNTRTVRVNIGDWKWLNALSQTLGTTVAEAFHKVITEQAHKAKTPTPEQAQIPMTLTTAYLAKPITAIATNGNKAIAFRIKPRGVRYD